MGYVEKIRKQPGAGKKYSLIIRKSFNICLSTVILFAVGLGFAVFKLLSKALIFMRDVYCAARSYMANIKVSRLTGVVVLTAAASLIVSLTFYGVGIEVMLDGETVGYIMDRHEYDEMVNAVEDRVEDVLKRPYALNSKINFQLGIIERGKILSAGEIEDILFEQATEVASSFVLTVDGEVVGANDNKEQLQGLLDEKLSVYSKDDPNTVANFVRDVRITQKLIDSAYIRPIDDIKGQLNGNVTEESYRTVKAGDSFSKIAQENGLSMAALQALNPTVTPNKLTVGQKLVVSEEIPLLSVKILKRVTYQQSIPYETITQNDDTIYKGTRKTKTAGVNGTADVVADVEYIDNREVKRDVISYKVVSEPKAAVVLVGTKTPPAKAASGKFRRPASGIVTSYYGYRRGGFHKGVDIASATGTPVVAADGGVVTYAGWKSNGFGNLVIIDHQNGYVTYYGHNSRILVRSGQKVAKGEQIAKMGSTGNSSGPHCHFEMYHNGRLVNPWPYIS